MSVITKPTVLVSSTIYDFADLRSALRYWLEQLGYEVLMSDFNDFPKSLDHNSYQSCLNAIAKADYFVLLIGRRVGGWFDEGARTSITRMEYREALKQFRATGKPRLAIFVRQNIWDIREDRSALLQHLRSDHAQLRELPESERSQLTKYPSRFVNDADTIFDFLNEVGQVEQMKAAAAGKAELPKANWIHQFTTFADIADALRAGFGMIDHTDRRVLAENLKQELLRNLARLAEKGTDGQLRATASWGIYAANSLVGGTNDRSKMPAHYLTRLVMFWISSFRLIQMLSTIFVRRAIESGLFMQFDSRTQSFESSKAHETLIELLEVIVEATRIASQGSGSSSELVDRFVVIGKQAGDVEVNNADIIQVCAQARDAERITDLTTRLIKWLYGHADAFDGLKPWSRSPLPAEARKLEHERVDPSEVQTWILGNQ